MRRFVVACCLVVAVAIPLASSPAAADLCEGHGGISAAIVRTEAGFTEVKLICMDGSIEYE